MSLITPKQISSTLGNQNLQEDIQQLLDNSVKLNVAQNSKDVTNFTGVMQAVFDSKLILNSESILLTSIVEVINTSEENITFEVINLDTEVHNGVIEPGRILSLNNDRAELVIKTNGSCKVNYTLRYID